MSTNKPSSDRKVSNRKSPHKHEATIPKELFPVITPMVSSKSSSKKSGSLSKRKRSLNDFDSSSEEVKSKRSDNLNDEITSILDEDLDIIISNGLSQQNWREIASDPYKGNVIAEYLQRLSNKCYQTELDLANAKKTNAAQRSIIDFELGWTNKFIDQSVAKAIEIANSNEESEAATANAVVQQHSSVIVSNSAPLRINSISQEQMQQFSDHLRRCVAEGVDDKRTAVLSQVAIVQLHRAFLTKSEGRVPVGAQSHLWMAWPTELLAEAVEYTFPRAGQSNLDWLQSFDKLFVELDIKDESSYMEYLNDITMTEIDAQYKITPVKQVIKALVANLSKQPKTKVGKVTRCNLQMQYELQRRHEESALNTIEQYIVQFGAIARRANRTTQQAILWNNSIDSPSSLPSENGKGGIDQNGQPSKVQKIERSICQGCGSILPAYMASSAAIQECRRCIGHPDRNTSGLWHQSAAKRSLSANGYSSINRKFRVSGEPVSSTVLSEMDKQLKLRFPETEAASTSARGQLREHQHNNRNSALSSPIGRK